MSAEDYLTQDEASLWADGLGGGGWAGSKAFRKRHYGFRTVEAHVKYCMEKANAATNPRIRRFWLGEAEKAKIP